MRNVALPKKEYLGHIVITMTRYFDNQPLTLKQIESFLKSVAVDDLETGKVQEAYERIRNKYVWHY